MPDTVANRSCPDCAVPLDPIKLLDMNYKSQVPALHYTSMETKPSLWDGAHRPVYQLTALMCPECGRVLLYGATAKNRLPLPAEADEPGAESLPRPSSGEG